MNPILPLYDPLFYKSDRLLSDVDRILVKEKNNVVCQFANNYDIKYRKYIRIIKHEDYYITGTPIKLPKYEGIPRAFSKTTYGFDISTSPWQDEVTFCYEPQEYKFKIIENYIDIPFNKAVYPIRVSIHEKHNPGNIIRIWAQDSDSDSDQWFALWNRSPESVPIKSSLFIPSLKICDFKTKMLRLEFKPSLWDYYINIGVKFIGTSKLILPRNPKESNLSLRNVISDYVQRLMQKHSRRLSLKNDLNSVKHEASMKLSSDESKELPRYSLSVLSDEIILKILVNLDLMTLCRLNQVNKRFYYLTQDSVLYKRLNMRNICHINTMCNIFRYFRPRCKNLQQLDLTGSDFSVSNFVKFLDNCGSHLTHLRLSRCSVNNFAIRKISEICKNLKQLDLDSCQFINDVGFSYLEKLQSLEHINVNYTNIRTERLCKILQKNQQIRQLHLEGLYLNLDTVAMQLRSSCQNLEVIYLNSSYRFFTTEAINALADCKHLRKVKLHDVYCDFLQDSWNRLFSSCQHLEEIILSNVNNKTLELLIQCQNLKRVRLHDSIHVASDKFSVIFEQCPKLQEFHLINCNTNSRLISQWKKRYPRVFIYVETCKEPNFNIFDPYSRFINSNHNFRGKVEISTTFMLFGLQIIFFTMTFISISHILLAL